MNFSEKYGNNIDEAVNLALRDLKVTRDEVNVTVLEEPSKGFLGIGSKLAKVRVEIKEQEKPETTPYEEENKTEEKLSEKEASESRIINKKDDKSLENKIKQARKRPENLEVVEEHKALDFLKQTTSEMGLDLQFTAKMNEENIFIDITGKDAGTIIGKRGQTLDSIQYLTSLVINKDRTKYMRVVLDAENYRSRREKTLEELAQRLAKKVVYKKRSIKLEPMNPYERMVIHASLQNHKKVKTRSEGEEPYRRVVVELK